MYGEQIVCKVSLNICEASFIVKLTAKLYKWYSISPLNFVLTCKRLENLEEEKEQEEEGSGRRDGNEEG